MGSIGGAWKACATDSRSLCRPCDSHVGKNAVDSAAVAGEYHVVRPVERGDVATSAACAASISETRSRIGEDGGHKRPVIRSRTTVR